MYGGNDYNPYNNQNPYNNESPNANQGYRRYPGAPSGERLASAAMVLGLLAIVTFFSLTIYPPLILGSIAIVLALLSKGRAPRMSTKARAGIACATIGLVANCILCATSIYMLCTKPEIMNQVNDIFRQQYGMSYTEMLEMILDDSGISAP